MIAVSGTSIDQSLPAPGWRCRCLCPLRTAARVMKLDTSIAGPNGVDEARKPGCRRRDAFAAEQLICCCSTELPVASHMCAAVWNPALVARAMADESPAILGTPTQQPDASCVPSARLATLSKPLPRYEDRDQHLCSALWIRCSSWGG